MRLLYEMFGMNEAGVANKPTAKKSKAKKKSFKGPEPTPPDEDVPEFGASDEPDEDDDEANYREEPGSDPYAEYPDGGEDADEPEPDWVGNEEEPEGEDVPPEEPEEPVVPFASKSQPPTARPQEPGLRMSGDRATMAKLRDVLDEVSARGRTDEDTLDWIDECVRAIDEAHRRNADSVSLPKFQETPDVDDLDVPDADEGEYEDA